MLLKFNAYKINRCVDSTTNKTFQTYKTVSETVNRMSTVLFYCSPQENYDNANEILLRASVKGWRCT